MGKGGGKKTRDTRKSGQRQKPKNHPTGRKENAMTARERNRNKHITAIKERVNSGKLTLSAAVSAVIIKWMMDHRLSPDIEKTAENALKTRRLVPLADVMTLWKKTPCADDWGERRAVKLDEKTAETLTCFWRQPNLFAGEDAEVIGFLYQKLLSTGCQKQGGIFYTPQNLAKLLTDMSGKTAKSAKILDPACGGGALLCAARDRLMADHPALTHREILEDMLWGIDTDAPAVIACRAVLALKSDTYVFPKHILRADALFDLKEPCWREFDRVIANPPYIGHKALKSAYMDDLRQQYPEVYGDKGDIAYCFYQNAVERLKDGGTAAFLVSRYFTEARSGEGLRRFLSEKTRIRRIIDFNGERVIKGVGIDPMIIVFEKRPGTAGGIDVLKRVSPERGEGRVSEGLLSRTDDCQRGEQSVQKENSRGERRPGEMTERVHFEKQPENNTKRVNTDKRKDHQRSSLESKPKLCKAAFPLKSCVIYHASLAVNPGENHLFVGETLLANKKFETFSVSQTSLGAAPWRLNDPMVRGIVEKIRAACPRALGGEGEFFQGIITGADSVFVIDRGQKKTLPALSPYLRPWIKNSRIHPCVIDDSALYLIYVRGSETAVSPELAEYLAPHKARLEKRRECQNGSIPWYALQWPRKPERFEGEKIIFPYKAEKNSFAFDEGGLFFSADIYGYIPGEIDAKALCVLLNSACYNLYFKSFAKKLGGALYEYYPNTLKRLAIPETKSSIYDKLRPYYDIIKCSYYTDTVIEDVEGVIARHFGLNEAQKQYIGVKYAKKLF